MADLLEVLAKIKLDTSDYIKGLMEAQKSSKMTRQEIVESFSSVEDAIENSQGVVDAFRNALVVSATETTTKTRNMREGFKALKTQIEMMKGTVKASENEVGRLSEALNKSAKETGIDSEETKDLAEQLDKAKKEMKDNQQELESLEKELKSYGKTTEEVNSKSEESGHKIRDAFGVVAKAGVEALKTTVELTAKAIAGAATGVGFLIKSSVSQYAEFEQLAGGAKLMWGEAYDFVMEKAKGAYLTVGRSQSEYLEQANGFSTSLKSSLEGDAHAAAQLADEIIQAEADIVAAQGISVEAVENAYNGLLRNNFTMLDNLKLGIQPTKEGFQSLIDTVNEWNKEQGKATNYSIKNYADMYKALNDYVTMQGLSGYASMEASDTITGSVASVKAAWANLVTGLSDDSADLGQLIDNFINMLVGDGEQVKGLLENIIPRVENAMNGVGELISRVIPIIVGRIPSYIENVLPGLLESGARIITTIVAGIGANIKNITSAAEQIIEMLGSTLQEILPTLTKIGIRIIGIIGSSILEHLDEILAVGGEILEIIVTGVSSHIGDIVDAAIKIVKSLGKFVIDNADMLLDAATEIIVAIAEGVTANAGDIVALALKILVTLTDSLLENLDVILACVPTLIQGFIDGLVENLPAMTDAWIKLMDSLELALPQIFDTILSLLPQIMDTLVNYWLGDGAKQTFKAMVIMFGYMTKALIQVAASLLAELGMFLRNIGSTIASEGSNIKAAFDRMWQGIKDIFSKTWTSLKSYVTSGISSILNVLKDKIKAMADVGRDLIQGLYDGIKNKFKWIITLVGDLAQKVIDTARKGFKESSPSKVFFDIGENLGIGLGLGWEDSIKDVNKMIEDDIHYQGEIDMTTKTTAVGQATLSESDLKKIISGLSFNFYNTTEIDGKEIKKDSYKYTLQKLGDDTRAVKIAMGGY